jgi:hypothetical protein
LALAGRAALAYSPQIAPPTPACAARLCTASFDAPLDQTCDLQLFEPRLVALANPAEAA